MPDNWTFVAAAYGLAAVVFTAYWRWLGRKEREVATLRHARTPRRHASQPVPVRPRPDASSGRP
jgi:hypothetical protein